MTTILDPLGTPAPFYNESGAAIVSITAGTDQSPTVIPSVSGETLALVSFVTSGVQSVVLPSGRIVGDIVAIAHGLSTTGGNIGVYAPSGESLVSGGDASVEHGAIFRKVTATRWARFS
jgi:hypothetical protein